MASHSRGVLRLPYRLSSPAARPSGTWCRHTSTAPTSKSESTSSYKIPPESPKFISIPSSRQPQAVPLIRQKGILPRPREVHKRNSKKATREYLDNVAPAPTRKPNGEALRGEAKQRMEWRQRLRTSRRRALREGLTELKARKDRTDAIIARRSAAKQADYERRVHAPDPDDVQFTSTTILQMADEDAAAQRKHDLAARRVKYARMQAAKEEERRTALHELYMNARDFIVDEKALDRRIEEEFERGWFGQHPDRGIWDKEGVPETAKWLLDYRRTTRRMGASQGSVPLEISQKRQQRMAEELTGGKIGT